MTSHSFLPSEEKLFQFLEYQDLLEVTNIRENSLLNTIIVVSDNELIPDGRII